MSTHPNDTTEAQVFVITGHLEGCCIRFGGEVVSVFDCYRDAKKALNAALAAPQELANTLNRKDA